MTTDKCIVCLEKAQYFSGHVLKDGKKITAGFCSSEHLFEATRNVYGGCLGDWKEEYELR